MTAIAPSPQSAAAPQGGGPAAGRRPSLLAAEVSRMASRRFVRWLFALGVLALLVGGAIASTQYAKAGPDTIAEAEQRMAAEVADQVRFWEECRAESTNPQTDCGERPTAEGLELEWYMPHSPFTMENSGESGALGVAALAAATAFLIGATYIGAEWSHRTIVALLFWQPRRLRVMGVKLAVTAITAAALALLAQALFAVIALGLTWWRGPGVVPPGYWGTHLGVVGRAVLLAIGLSWLGFGLAHLARNTAAALGIGFLYSAVIESAVAAFWERSAPYLLTSNIMALMQPGGFPIWMSNEETFDEQGNIIYGEAAEVVLSNLHGGIGLAVYVGVVLAVGAVLFRRRDLH